MKLSIFFRIMESYFDHLVIVEKGKKKTIVNKVFSFLNAFFDDADENKNPLYDLTDDFIRKIFNGTETLPAHCARFYYSHLSELAFDDFIEDVEDSVVQNMIDELETYNIFTNAVDFAKDITALLRQILYNIINFPPSATLRYAEFLGGNKVKIGDLTLNLPPELDIRSTPLKKENKYINALLEVYAQDSKNDIKTIEDLETLSPIYSHHFKLQRKYFYSAESVLHQIRDIFKDAVSEFDYLKNETHDAVESYFTMRFKNGFERLNQVLLSITLYNYSQASLGFGGKGLIGPNEKKGILHMLVNDEKIKWVMEYDENI